MNIMEKNINYIVSKVPQLSDNGLYHGKMGIVLALYCYGKVHHKQKLCDFACDILQLSDCDYYKWNVGLENGLAGIGLGFCLMYKAGMFDDDLNGLLSEIDKHIMAMDPRRIEDYSFRNGALGILYYSRVRRSVNQKCNSLKLDYIKELEKYVFNKTSARNRSQTFLSSLQIPKWKPREYLDKSVGLDNGCSFFLINETYDKVFSCK